MRGARIGPALGLAILTALSPAAGQTYRERVEVGLVRVELFVRGSGGRPVEDLKPSEIRLRVDGRPVAVDGLAPVRTSSAENAPDTAAEGSAPSASPPVSSSPAPGAATDQIAILIDDTTTEQFNRNSIYVRLRELVESLPGGATVLLQRFDGKLHVICPWTSDRSALLASLESMRSRGALPRLRDRTVSSGTGDDFDSPELAGMMSRVHGRTSLAALYEAVLRFPLVSGRRRALLFITDGGPFQSQIEITRELIDTTSLSEQPSLLLDRQETRRREADRRRDAAAEDFARSRTGWISQLTDITRLATRREIALIPVRSAPHDAGGLGADRSISSEQAPDASNRAFQQSFSARLAVNQTMGEMARVTGGEPVLSRAKLSDHVGRFLQERASAYVLTFRDPFPGDSRDHRIEIEVLRPRVDLRYRRFYRIHEASSIAEDVVTRLYEPAPSNPLGAGAAVRLLRSERNRSIARLTIAYPVPPEAGGTPNGWREVSVLAVCATDRGERSEPIRYAGPVKVVAGAREARVLLYFDLRMSPARYTWSVAVTDQPTRITSFLHFESVLGD